MSIPHEEPLFTWHFEIFQSNVYVFEFPNSKARRAEWSPRLNFWVPIFKTGLRSLSNISKEVSDHLG